MQLQRFFILILHGILGVPQPHIKWHAWLGLKPRALPKVGLSSDSAEGWVKVNDVLTSDYFKDMTKEILMKVLG